MTVDTGPNPFVVAIVVIALVSLCCVMSATGWYWRPEAQAQADYDRLAAPMRIDAERQRLADEAHARQFNQAQWEQIAPAIYGTLAALLIACVAAVSGFALAKMVYQIRAAQIRPILTQLPTAAPVLYQLPNGAANIYDGQTGRQLQAGQPAPADALTVEVSKTELLTAALSRGEHGQQWIAAAVDTIGGQLVEGNR